MADHAASPRTVVYSFVVADLFHYGHLQLLQTAKALGDYHICGVLTDEAAATYRPRPITNFDERVAVISSIRTVDRVVLQDSKDPTANLQKLHAEFPQAELVLVHANDWRDVPGRAYVEAAGGRVVQPEYYRRLSDSRVRRQVASEDSAGHYELFTEHFRVDRIVVFDETQRRFVFSTKANTLKALRPILRRSRIEPVLAFRVSEWTEDRGRILDLIRRGCGSSRLVVRSSAMSEDGYAVSEAGRYLSRLNVSSRRSGELGQAIDEVVASYRDRGSGHPLNQVLVQPQARGVHTSGVVFTRHQQDGGPYYVINYDDRTGATDTVTGGAVGQMVEIAHACPPREVPSVWRQLVAAVREVERIIPGTPLDIEFGIDRGNRITLFQVRPLTVRNGGEVDPAGANALLRRTVRRVRNAIKRRPHLAGRTTCFSDMAFWNPAEIIGDRPNPLDASLYRHLVMDRVWHEALEPLGYTPLRAAPLMVEFAGKPYVDLRCTCNALLPTSLSRRLREKLANYYLQLLAAQPELHDKVEFAVIDNCFYFTLDRRLAAMRRAGFTAPEVTAYRAGIVEITRIALARGPCIEDEAAHHGLCLARARQATLEALDRSRPEADGLVAAALQLLADARTHGTVPFTLTARLAFIGKRLLRSTVECGWLSEADYERFMDSIRTVATEIYEDSRAVAAARISLDEFLERYGHLRPGTYDILSRRYADGRAGFTDLRVGADGARAGADQFSIPPRAARAIEKAFGKVEIPVSAEAAFQFIRFALEARERLKFEFTKNLSEALELLARAGERLGFTREEIAHLDVPALARAAQADDSSTGADWRRVIDGARRRRGLERAISLPPLVFQPRDVWVIERHRARPNFITRQRVRAPLVSVNGMTDRAVALQGSVVLIEKADPGYDWLFTKGIAGLITKYGGVASHMAIRCAEFGLPAAIGCGEVIYQELLVGVSAVLLDCKKGHVVPLA